MKKSVIAITLCASLLAGSVVLTSCESGYKTSESTKRSSIETTEETEEDTEEDTEDTSEETTEETTEETAEETTAETTAETSREFVDCDIDINDVKVIKSVSQLYDYNDDYEDLFYNEDDTGYINMCFGCITDFTVDSPDEALIALYSVQKLFKCKDALNDFVYTETQFDGDEYYYCFQQVKDGISVPLGIAKIITDSEGNTTGFISSYVPIHISTEASLTEEDAIEEIEKHKEIYSSELVIWTFEHKQVLTWKIVYVASSDGMPYEAYVDANTGEIVDVIPGYIS